MCVLAKLKIEKLIFLAFVILSLNSCTDVFERNLENTVVDLNAPPEGFETENQLITFWWEEIENVEGYRLQIVRPSFDQTEYLLVDSLFSESSTVYSLIPGKYEWRVRPENNFSNGNWVTRGFEILESTDLSNQILIPELPLNKDTTNEKSIRLSWFPLASASSYKVQIWDGPGNLMILDTLTGIEYMFTNVKEGSFLWEVVGINSISESMGIERSFYIDTTAPSTPVPIKPINGYQGSIDSIVSFTWQNNQDNGSRIESILSIYKDSLLTEKHQELTTYSSEAEVSFQSSSDYYWYLKSVDQAGNESVQSIMRRIDIQ